ncbi:MAG: hypothetical protein ACR2PS_10715, partial [Pseudomonadales bacterium]
MISGNGIFLATLQEQFISRQKNGSGSDDSAFWAYVTHQLSLALNIAERHLPGARYKVPRQVGRKLRSDPSYRQAVASLAAKEDRTVPALRRETKKYMEEMISIPSTFFLDAYAKFNNFFLGLGYESKLVYSMAEIERVRQLVRENPTMLLWTHKTYMDGPAALKVLYDNDFPMPHLFGGANADFAGFGFLTRRAGGIFIRRSFKDKP